MLRYVLLHTRVTFDFFSLFDEKEKSNKNILFIYMTAQLGSTPGGRPGTPGPMLGNTGIPSAPN